MGHAPMVPAPTVSVGCVSVGTVVPASIALTLFANAVSRRALPDAPEHEAEEPSLEVLALADDDVVDVGRAVVVAREGVGVA